MNWNNIYYLKIKSFSFLVFIRTSFISIKLYLILIIFPTLYSRFYLFIWIKHLKSMNKTYHSIYYYYYYYYYQIAPLTSNHRFQFNKLCDKVNTQSHISFYKIVGIHYVVNKSRILFNIRKQMLRQCKHFQKNKK